MHKIVFTWGVIPVAVSDKVAQSLRRFYFIKNVVVIPNGIPVQENIRPAAAGINWREKEGVGRDDIVFVCIARFSLQKNHRLLLEAFKMAFDKTNGIKLLLIGAEEHDYREKAEKLVSLLRLEDNVRILGMREDIPEILSASDIFVLSSDWEGNPLTIMEAMAAGKPVISTAVGGVPELIESGINGLLVRPGRVEELSRAMLDLYKDKNKREFLGSAAKKTALERFDVKIMVKRYEELYLELARRKELCVE
jgi:glycosyltransferase involved in cell wall biosynthesis